MILRVSNGQWESMDNRSSECFRYASFIDKLFERLQLHCLPQTVHKLVTSAPHPVSCTLWSPRTIIAEEKERVFVGIAVIESVLRGHPR